MSYILDALRKADSDRERGAVPGIHTQATPGVAGDMRSERSSGPLVWVVVVLSAVVVALLAWLLFGRDKAPESAPAPVVAALPPPQTQPAPIAPVAVEPVARAPAPAIAKPPPATPRVTAPAPAAKPALPAPTPARSASAAAAAKPAASAPPRIYALSELPDNIRRELPQLAIGSSMYSENPANRFLLINGQVFHEGDKVGPELWLVEIKLKAAVLRFRDYRYTIRF
jgi:general secretion pathway protein B